MSNALNDLLVTLNMCSMLMQIKEIKAIKLNHIYKCTMFIVLSRVLPTFSKTVHNNISTMKMALYDNCVLSMILLQIYCRIQP